MRAVTQLQQIRSVIGEPSAYAAKKITQALHPGMIDFIQQTRLLFMSSVDADGFPTVTPRGDEAGFVHVKDEKTLLIPERKGNKLAMSLQNILQNNKVGLILVVPNTAETLRISGVAKIIHDPDLNQRMASSTQAALLVIEVRVEQCFFHCAKSFLRSAVWQPDTWQAPMRISLGAELARGHAEAQTLAVNLDEAIQQRYKTDL